MTAGIVKIGGGWGGELWGAGKYNQKGFFENLPITQKIIKPFLKDMGYDPMFQKPLPDIDVISVIATKILGKQWRDQVLNVIKSQGYNDSCRWFLKCPKMSGLWPLWNAAFPEAQWIISERSDRLIIKSCHNTSFMTRYDTNEGWQKWIDYHKERFDEMESNGLDVSRVNAEKLVHGDHDEMKAAIENVGLEWRQSKIDDFIDVNIWNTIK